MLRFVIVAIGGLLVSVVMGCQGSVDPGRFKPYGQLTAAHHDVPGSHPVGESDAQPTIAAAPIDDATAAVGADGSVVEIPVSALAPVNVVDGSNAAAVLNVVSASATRPAAPEGPANEIQLMVAQRDFKSEGPQGALRVSYDDLDLLKILNMEPVPDNAVTYFPPWLKHLEGQRIRLRGFMYPTFEATGIEQFVLARDNQICCFGRNPKVYDLVTVQLRAGVTTDYILNRPFDVVGTFHIDLVAEGGKQLGLYWLEDGVVINK